MADFAGLMLKKWHICFATNYTNYHEILVLICAIRGKKTNNSWQKKEEYIYKKKSGIFTTALSLTQKLTT